MFTTPLLSCSGETWTWAHAIAAAHLRGEWEPLVVRASVGLARQLSGVEADETVASATARAWRYERNLLAGEELEAWLEARGLDTDGWYDWIDRTVLRQGDPEGPAELDEADLDEALRYELHCTRDGVRVALRLAAALAISSTEQLPELTRPELAPGVALPTLDDPTWARLAAIEQRYQALRPALAPTARVQAVLQAHQLDWTRIEGRAVRFAELHAAAEAVLCIQEDGMDLAAVADMAGQQISPFVTEICDAPRSLRGALLSAVAGEVLGPLWWDDLHLVIAVATKAVPSPDDEVALARARERVLSQVVRQAVDERVEWLRPL